MNTQENKPVETANGATRFNESYLRSQANQLRAKARKEARESGFEPIFDKGFVLVYNERHNYLHLQVHFTLNGSSQVYGVAI